MLYKTLYGIPLNVDIILESVVTHVNRDAFCVVGSRDFSEGKAFKKAYVAAERHPFELRDVLTLSGRLSVRRIAPLNDPFPFDYKFDVDSFDYFAKEKTKTVSR